jgi:hypothetical protein
VFFIQVLQQWPFRLFNRLFVFNGAENNFLSITTPVALGGTLKKHLLHHPLCHRKIARRSFSSGVGSVSPFGVILPIKDITFFDSAPMRMIPFSSRSLVASSLTFGISAVNSSTPRFVSRTSVCTHLRE